MIPHNVDYRVCSIEGCARKHHARGWCIPHWRRWKRHGDPLAGRTPEGEPARFYQEKVLTYEGDECLLWPYSTLTGGYGHFWIDGKNELAHRVVCKEVNGEPPTPKHHAAHSCGNGHLGCVTKKHLRWDTCKGNAADRIVHGTYRRGEECGSAKLTADNVHEIRLLSRNGQPAKSIAGLFNVSSRTIFAILKRSSWAWLD